MVFYAKGIVIMGLTMIIALLLLMIGIVVVKSGKWKIFVMIIMVLSVGILSYLKGPIFLQESTSLEDEGIDEVKIGALVDEEETIAVERNVFYDAWKKNPVILLRVDHGIIREVTLAADASASTVSTKRGITLESTFAEVVEMYGDAYRNLRFVEMYGTGIEYRDKKNGVMLQFYFDNDQPSSQVRDIVIMKR